MLYSYLKNASARGGLLLEGEIVRYSSVSRSLTFGRNEKVEQHIKNNTRKLNVLRFWVEGGVILLYRFSSILILVRSPRFLPSDYQQILIVN